MPYVSLNEKKGNTKSAGGYVSLRESGGVVEDKTPTPLPSRFQVDVSDMSLGTEKAVSTPAVAEQPVLDIGSVGKTIAQGGARDIAGLTTTIAGKPEFEFKPKSKAEKIIFGSEPFSAQQEAVELAKLLGIPEEKSKHFGPVVLAGLTLSDLFSVPGKKQAFISLLKKTDNADKVADMLKKNGIPEDLSKEFGLSKRIAESTSTKEIDDLLTAVEKMAKNQETAAKANPKTKAHTDPTKFKSADEFIEAQGTPVYHESQSETPITTFKPIDYGEHGEHSYFYFSEKPGALKKMLNGGASDDVSPIKQTIKAHVDIKKPLNLNNQSARTLDEWVKYLNEQGVDVPQSVLGKIEQAPGRHIAREPWQLFRGDMGALRKSLLDAGYDGILWKERGGKTIVALSPDQIKTKSQLTDIYNKAQKPKNAGVKNTAPRPAFRQELTGDEAINTTLERYSEAAKKPVTPDSDLAREAKISRDTDGVKKLFGEALTPISSRLGRINLRLKGALRKLEFDSAQRTHKDSVVAADFMSEGKKMTMKDQAIFDLAKKNGDSDIIQAIADRYGFADKLDNIRKVLDDIYKRAKDVGIDVSYRKDYFPRMVKNPAKFVAYLRNQPEWGEIRRVIEKHAEDKGLKYTDLSEEEISGIVNTFLRGYGDATALAQPGFKMPRTVDVVDEGLNAFYESSDTALSTYIVRMNDEIESRRFFGKEIKLDPKNANTEDSIGAYVFKLIEDKKIKPDQEKEVADILRSRFHRGKMNGALDVYRNVEYIATMGSPVSALTQIGDVAWSLYDNGIWHTLKGIKKSVGKKANRITKEDLGIEQITQEFANQTKTGRALDKVFKAIGLERIDRLGKESLVNGEMSKFQSMAKKNPDMLKMELRKTFDEDEVTQAFQEFAEGSVTERTKLVLFNKLLDFQPVAKSEMPQKYLEMPNGRIFYMLKSFTLKQIDIFRREAIDDIVSGNPRKVRQGMQKLLRLGGSFMLMNVTADELKDLLLDRETSIEDRVVDNLWRVAGATKFDVYKARQDGVGQTVLKKILFPTSIFDTLYKDAANLAEDKRYEKGPLKGEKYKVESIQRIPVGGKLYYWWFGRGAQKKEQKEGVPNTDGTLDLPKLPKLPKLPTF